METSESSILASQEMRKRQELVQCQNELIAHFEQRLLEMQHNMETLEKTHAETIQSMRHQLSEEHAKELEAVHATLRSEHFKAVAKAEDDTQRLKKTYRRRLQDFARLVNEAETNYSLRASVAEKQLQQVREELLRQEARSDAKEKSLLQELLLKETRIKGLEASLLQAHVQCDSSMSHRETLAIQLSKYVLRLCAEAEEVEEKKVKVSQKTLNKCFQLSQVIP